MEIERDAEKKIGEWYSGKEGCLCLYGTRGIGKSHTARVFLSRACPAFFEADLRDEKTGKLLSNTRDPGLLARKLKRLSRGGWTEGDAVLLDGALTYPRLVAAADELSRGGTKAILTGERLPDLSRVRIRPPAGKIVFLRMYPVSFTEYLRAAGVEDEKIGRMRGCAERLETPDAGLHEEIMGHFRDYLFVGGMPEAVEGYLEGWDVSRSMEPHDRALGALRRCAAERDDAEGTERRILDTVPCMLDRPRKAFSYMPRPGESADRERVFSAADDLQDSWTLIPAYVRQLTSAARFFRHSYNLRRLYMCDVGLLSNEYAAREYVRPGFRAALFSDAPLVHGAVHENFVAEELTCRGIRFWLFGRDTTESTAFMVPGEGGTDAVYVTAGKSPGRHVDALSGHADVRRVYELRCGGEVERDGAVVRVPVYMAAFLPFGE